MADTYDIVGDVPITDVSPAGGFVPAREITFTTKPSGRTGRVRVPLAEYTPDRVDEIVAEQARTIERVQAL